jgi:hypothetical protein
MWKTREFVPFRRFTPDWDLRIGKRRGQSPWRALVLEVQNNILIEQRKFLPEVEKEAIKRWTGG